MVEDDPDLATSLSVRLKSACHAVHVAPDSITALHACVRLKPDLMISDLGLPGGDGVTMLKRLREHPKLDFVPVVVLTARDESYREIALAAGAQDFFQKPADTDRLMAAINSHLNDEAPAQSADHLTLSREHALAMLRTINS